jgi:hypothetical protein
VRFRSGYTLQEALSCDNGGYKMLKEGMANARKIKLNKFTGRLSTETL